MDYFEAFYNSPAQHPGLLWISAAAAGAWALRRRGLDPSMRRYLAGLTLLSLADAWLSSSHVYGLGALTGVAAATLPLFFVLMGDFRYLVLLEVAVADGSLRWSARALARAAALTLIVPLSSQAVLAALPSSLDTPRMLYFVYEVGFLILTSCLLVWHPGLGRAAWLKPVSFFVLLYYGLWALADLVLLTTGSDLGFALRVLPNVLYYGGLIAVMGWAASSGSGDERGPPA